VPFVVKPYKRRPEPPRVAVVLPDGTALLEGAGVVEFGDWPKDARAFVDFDTARELVEQGIGESLCWNGEEFRWRRHPQPGPDWKRSPSDAGVLRVPFYERPARTLEHLRAWRDWLAGEGATLTSTTGSASWSLLRATLEQPLFVSIGTRPPLLQTLGGRQELGPAGPGRYRGTLQQLDLPAAYAHELASLRYGGRWYRGDELATRPAGFWARDDRPVFCRARVRLAGTSPGPLPKRSRRRVYGLAGILLGAHYPTAGTLQGLWTYQELERAHAHGARIKLLETYVHLGGSRPFAPWWQAVERGRELPGLAGLLAKTTGNALWGQFCINGAHNGDRSILRRGKRGQLERRPLRSGPSRPPAHDLAETVSGRTRARLYDAMHAAGAGLLSAHTDGVWIDARRVPVAELEQDGWRSKATATKLELLNPQVLRYWPRGRPGPEIVYAGMPARQASQAFEDAWRTYQEGVSDAA
jgi:hypothetical protein